MGKSSVSVALKETFPEVGLPRYGDSSEGYRARGRSWWEFARGQPEQTSLKPEEDWVGRSYQRSVRILQTCTRRQSVLGCLPRRQHPRAKKEAQRTQATPIFPKVPIAFWNSLNFHEPPNPCLWKQSLPCVVAARTTPNDEEPLVWPLVLESTWWPLVFWYYIHRVTWFPGTFEGISVGCTVFFFLKKWPTILEDDADIFIYAFELKMCMWKGHLGGWAS